MLNAELDAARGGLASLADSAWMMTLSRQDSYGRHPAGRARPGAQRPDSAAGPVAVTFGIPSAASEPAGPLPVHWEPVGPDDAPAVLLSGDITAVPAAGQGQASLVLAGFCQVLPGASNGGEDERASVEALKEVARSFITTVAVIVACSLSVGQDAPLLGPASSWVTGQRSAS